MLLLPLLSLVAARATAPRWRNSSIGIHAFLTFDGGASSAGIAEHAPLIDFVWVSGSTPAWIPPPSCSAMRLSEGGLRRNGCANIGRLTAHGIALLQLSRPKTAHMPASVKTSRFSPVFRALL